MFSVSLAHCPSKKQVDLYCNRQEHWISSQIILLQISNIRHTNGGIWNTKKSRFYEVRRNYCTEQNSINIELTPVFDFLFSSATENIKHGVDFSWS